MALSQDDREWMIQTWHGMLQAHEKGCEHGRQLDVFRAKLGGIVIGVSAVCTVAGIAIGWGLSMFLRT